MTIEEAYKKYENGMYVIFKKHGDTTIIQVEREV